MEDVLWLCNLSLVPRKRLTLISSVKMSGLFEPCGMKMRSLAQFHPICQLKSPTALAADDKHPLFSSNNLLPPLSNTLPICLLN